MRQPILGRRGEGTDCAGRRYFLGGGQTKTLAQARQVLELGGTYLSYVEKGSGEPLLLIPSLDESVLVYAGQLAHPERLGRVIAYDHPGSGLSDRPAIDYSPRDYLRFAVRFVDKAIDRPALVCAHGSAAPLGISLSATRPEKVRALVLVCPDFPEKRPGTPLSKVPRPAPLVAVADLRLKAMRYIQHHRKASQLSRSSAARSLGIRRNELYSELRGPAWFTIEKKRAASWGLWTEWMDRAAEIEAPVYLFLTRRLSDRAREEIGSALRNVAISEVVEIDGSSTHPMLENPEGFEDAIVRIIAQT
jgi:pimeloyl-ACP methyl ester carboxylesterase